jgi:phytanoyl-CoA hydroxylase
MCEGGGVVGLSVEQLESFNQQGFVVVDDVVDPVADLDPIVREYEGVLDKLTDELFEAGAISSRYEGLPLSERLTRVYAESGRSHQQWFDPSLPQSGIKADTPMWTGPAMFRLFRNEGLLDRLESLLGSEIMSNPVQHVRIKLPEHLMPAEVMNAKGGGGATPWHQDNGVVTEDADDTQIVTVWLPLFDATVEMGCLAVVPGSHRNGLLSHCPSPDNGRIHVPDKLFHPEAAVPVPMRRGSAIFMHRCTLHSSLPNVSDQVRWSLDLRFQPVGQPTGRSVFPGFVTRSRLNPDTELRDPQAWTDMWLNARRELAEREQPRFNRWDSDAPVCA